MFRTILTYGGVAGLIAGAALSASTVASGGHSSASYAMVVGYLMMLIALSAVFVGVKRRRDVDLGGVIRFWPALGLGLAMSAVAGVIYVAAWELTQALAHLDFGSTYAKAMVAQAQAHGASGPALAKAVAEAETFRAQYADPLYRWPMTFAEIFPVGVVVSLVSAALLRNSRFLPARNA